VGALAARAVPDGAAAAVRWLCERPGTPTVGARRAGVLHALRAAPRDGPALEFGVRYGVSARVLAAHRVTVHGFDSFEGLPRAWQGMAAGAFSMEGRAPELPANVVLHRGWFAEVAPAVVARIHLDPAIVHLDGDLYESARDALTAVAPRVRAGCVLLFDEYLGNEGWRDDEHRAWEACAREHGWRAEVLCASLVTGQVALRVRG